MGPKAREAAVHTAFRSCQRKRFREDQPQVTLECARCKLGMPIKVNLDMPRRIADNSTQNFQITK